MKHILILLGMFGVAEACGQTFDLIDIQDSYQGGVSQTVTIPLKIKNTTSKAQVYIFRKIQDDLTNSQKGYFCVDKNCLEQDQAEVSLRLEPGEIAQNVYFTIETGLVSGQHFVKFEIFPRGSPGQSIEHSVTVAIEDRAIKTRVFASKEITIHDIYPNPVTDQAYIEYAIHVDGVKAKAVIHNILGRFMADYELSATETRVKIQAEDLPAGIYFYTIYLDNEGVLTRKMLVRK